MPTVPPRLPELEAEIERIDRALLHLLRQRGRTVLERRQAATESGAEILDSTEDEAVLALVRRENEGPFYDDDLIAIFQVILRRSRELVGHA